MLTTVRPFSRAERAIKAWWPEWRAPSVATKPAASPARASRSAARVVTISGVIASPAVLLGQRGRDLRLHRVRVAGGRKGLLAHITGVGGEGRCDRGVEIGVPLGEAGRD